MKRVLIFLISILCCVSAQALILEKPLNTAAQEERAQALFETMRCMVCEGQPLASSDARHARDMRATIRAMIQQGESDAAIQDFFYQRYGDEIFTNPPAKASAILLWAAPFCMLVIAVLMVWRKRRATL